MDSIEQNPITIIQQWKDILCYGLMVDVVPHVSTNVLQGENICCSLLSYFRGRPTKGGGEAPKSMAWLEHEVISRSPILVVTCADNEVTLDKESLVKAGFKFEYRKVLLHLLKQVHQV